MNSAFNKPARTLAIGCVLIAALTGFAAAKPLKAHDIYSSHMVLQRDKPIMIWGWTDTGDKVSVAFGDEKAETTAAGRSCPLSYQIGPVLALLPSHLFLLGSSSSLHLGDRYIRQKGKSKT